MMLCEICGCEFDVTKMPESTECGECAGFVECDVCGMWVEECTDVNGKSLCEDCVDENYTKCEDCGEWVANEDAHETHGGSWVCDDCYANNYATCDRCGCVFAQDDAQSTPDGDTYCEACFDQHCDHCGHCGNVMWYDDSYEAPNGDYYCRHCYHNNCTTCDGCGGTIWLDDAVNTDDGIYCEGCAPENGNFLGSRFVPNDSYNRIGSRRRFGVEIETAVCNNYSTLEGEIPFDAKYDGSIGGKEFASMIFFSDAGLAAIDNLCAFAKRNRWRADRNCGLHVHLDVSDHPLESLKAITLAYYLTYDVWKALVESSRHSNHYCGPHRTDMVGIKSITNFLYYSENQNRYEWFNTAAYCRHRTFEIRMHEGTVDAEAICNWVRIHAIFMDWAAKHTFDEVKKVLFTMGRTEKFDFIARLAQEAGCSDLIEYYLNKSGITDSVFVACAV